MLAIICGIALVIYFVLTLRIKPHRYPDVPEEKIYAWQRQKIKNSRRYAGLFLIYIILAIVAGVVVTYARHHGYTSLFYIILAVELAYIIFCTVYIIRNARRTMQLKHELFQHKLDTE